MPVPRRYQGGLIRGARRSYRTLATSTVQTSGGGLPPDTTVGQPAWRMIGWGAGDWIYGDTAFHQTWRNAGFGGCVYLHSYPFGVTGGTDDFQATSAASNSGSQWVIQQQLEGLSNAPAPNQSMGLNAHAVGNKAYFGVRFQSADQIAGAAPFNVPWSDTTTRAIVAAFFGRMAGAAKLCHLDGLAGDQEPYYGKTWDATGYTGAGTVAQNRADAYAWGYAIGQAVFANFPGCEMVIYSWYIPGGWNAELLQGAGFNTKGVQIDFWHGYLTAMKDANAGGRLICFDATWYRESTQVSGATVPNALKYNTQNSLAYLSTYFAQATWDYVCDKIDITPFSWRGTDSSAYYINTEPSDAAWAQMVADYRLWGMGQIRAEYNYEGSPDLASGYSYSSAAMVAGGVAAASTSPVDATVPTISNVVATNNGNGTYTITFQAAHSYGIRCAKVWVAPTGVVTGARMTWNQNGGNYTTNYANAFQACSATVIAAAGNTINITATSTKDELHGTSIVV